MSFKFTKADKRLTLIYFLIATPISWTMDWEDYRFDSYKNILVFALDNLVFISISFATIYILVYVLFSKYLPKGAYLKLFILVLILLLCMGGLDINYSCWMYKCKGLEPTSFRAFYYGMLNILENVGVLATLLLGKKLVDMQVNVAKIEKEKKESELRFLKAQIDPHFLFNNLNTVDSLIDTDPQKAKLYLNKLGQLYRYLISSKDQEVVELEEELSFAKNYIYLIEQRFGNAYTFDIKDNTTINSIVFIPPGALQTLLENVVKHNQGTDTEPIKTSIEINDRFIKIENDVRLKMSKVDSMGTGLENLKKRYKLLTDKSLHIHSDEVFSVKLPIIQAVD